MSNQTKSGSEELDRLIGLYTAYCECEEWHIHQAIPEDHIEANADNNDGHMTFDEDRLKAGIRQWALSQALNAKPKSTKPRDIIALYWQHLEFGADKGITESEAISAIEALLASKRRKAIEECMGVLPGLKTDISGYHEDFTPEQLTRITAANRAQNEIIKELRASMQRLLEE